MINIFLLSIWRKFNYLILKIGKEIVNDDLVYFSQLGDLRKDKSQILKDYCEVDESALQLLVRRFTSGKGRTVIEI